MEQPDRDIAADVLAGDQAVFRVIVERYQDRLFDLALRMTRSRQDAEDLVQTAFIRMFAKLKSYDRRYAFSTWAYTITLNLVRNHQRRKRLIRFLSLEAAPEPRAEDAPAPRLERAIAELPETLREAFVLHYIHEEPVRAVAEMLGVSENAAKLRLLRARGALRERIQGDLNG
ncbi:MAG: RNA polymerase sigma factor [Elusimicrobiota bacterium]